MTYTERDQNMNLATDCREKRIMNNDLLSFLKDIDCSDMQFKLLCFWGRHPRAKLSLYTMAGALDVPRNNLTESITALVGEGILVAQHNSNGLTTYTLFNDQRTQKYMDEIAKLDWSSIKSIGEELKKEAVSA